MKILFIILFLSVALVNCTSSRPESYRTIQDSNIVLSNPNPDSRLLSAETFRNLSHSEKEAYLQRLSEEEKLMFYNNLLDDTFNKPAKQFKQ